MEDSKSFASLTPSLLARKGGARPAMRPQLLPLSQIHENVAHQMNLDEDDLGWNDHGEDHGPLPATDQISPASESVRREARIVPIKGLVEERPLVVTRSVPDVVRQQDSINDRLTAVPDDAEAVQRRSALTQGRRAAFTLRLDAERHLKLRLACAVDSRSAQQIVTEALDRLIADMPEIEALAARVRRNKFQKGDLS